MLDQIVRLYESGDYDEAMKAISSCIADGSANSEIYRLKGQIEFDGEEHDKAVNSLIESLKLDDKNQSALILIGNIYALHKDDFDTAMTYFTQVLELNSDNYVGLNNIAGIIAKHGDYQTAISYFVKAIEVKPGYPNALFGSALCHLYTEDYRTSFDQSIEAMQNIEDRTEPEFQGVYDMALNLSIDAAQKYAEQIEPSAFYQDLIKDLQKETNKDIEIVEDTTIGTPAKMEIAETYQREKHIIKIQSFSAINAYYVMHELMHLQLITEARRVGENELFKSTIATKELFEKRFNKYATTLQKAGVPSERHEALCDQLYHGLCLQLYNAPIDLFIEKRLYDQYPDLRPIHILGLIEISKPAIEGATSKSLKKMVPPYIREPNIAMSTTLLLQLKELYGIDYLSFIKEEHLIDKGKALYNDYVEMRDDKSPAEEYDVIRWWGEELKLTKYFMLELETV